MRITGLFECSLLKVVNEYRGNIQKFQENVKISVTTINKQSHSEVLYYFLKGENKRPEGACSVSFLPFI